MARDVASAVAFMKYRVPGVPILLIGESMGGVIAVRAAGSGRARTSQSDQSDNN